MSTQAFYYALLAKKKRDLQRLEACSGKLGGKQQEFADNQELMTKPALSLTTWHGDHATGFDGIRKGGVLAGYQEIQGAQFNKAFAELAAKSEEVGQEILSIEQMIAQLPATASRRRHFPLTNTIIFNTLSNFLIYAKEATFN